MDVLNVKGEKVSSVDLPEAVFGVKGSPALVHEVINAYLANRRRGTHSTKTRGEVSGGGVKPWKQKHTGRARSGSIRSPLWRHGGVTFGPKPRSYYQSVPEAKRRLALKMILTDLVKDGRMKVVDAVSVPEPKTKHVAAMVKKLNAPGRTVMVLDQIEPVFLRAARNMAGLRLCRVENLNSYDALQAEQLIFSKPALDKIVQRLNGDLAPAGPAAGKE